MTRAVRMTLLAGVLLSAGSASALAGQPGGTERAVTEPGMPWPVVEDREKPSADRPLQTPPDGGSVTVPGMPWPVVREGAEPGGTTGGAGPSGAGPSESGTSETNTATQPGMPWPVISEDEAKRLQEAAPSPAPLPAPAQAVEAPPRNVTEPGMPWPVVQEPPKATQAPERAACAAALKAALAAGPLTFGSGGAEIETASRATLMKVAAALKTCGSLSITVSGYTDARGSPAQNLALSKARAAAVARFLVRQGIAEKRLKTEGFGAEKPIASNETAEGRAKNRRIEILIAPGGAGAS